MLDNPCLTAVPEDFSAEGFKTRARPKEMDSRSASPTASTAPTACEEAPREEEAGANGQALPYQDREVEDLLVRCRALIGQRLQETTKLEAQLGIAGNNFVPVVEPFSPRFNLSTRLRAPGASTTGASLTTAMTLLTASGQVPRGVACLSTADGICDKGIQKVNKLQGVRPSDGSNSSKAIPSARATAGASLESPGSSEPSPMEESGTLSTAASVPNLSVASPGAGSRALGMSRRASLPSWNTEREAASQQALIEAWTEEEVAHFLEGLNLASLIPAFARRQVAGHDLLRLTESELLNKFGVKNFFLRQRLLRGIQALQTEGGRRRWAAASPRGSDLSQQPSAPPSPSLRPRSNEGVRRSLPSPRNAPRQTLSPPSETRTAASSPRVAAESHGDAVVQQARGHLQQQVNWNPSSSGAAAGSLPTRLRLAQHPQSLSHSQRSPALSKQAVQCLSSRASCPALNSSRTSMGTTTHSQQSRANWERQAGPFTTWLTSRNAPHPAVGRPAYPGEGASVPSSKGAAAACSRAPAASLHAQRPH